MWKVEYEHANAGSAWTTHGTYGSESYAISMASQVAGRHFATRVLSSQGSAVWSA